MSEVPVSEERHPLKAHQSFRFHCHPKVSCFLTCCHQIDLSLFPYDVVRLKHRLGLNSEQFLRLHARIAGGSHPYFPGVKLMMADKEGYPCPFLDARGCTVYEDRPSACRTYPLERGVERLPLSGRLQAHYQVVQHPYCMGHAEPRNYTISQWERDQELREFNRFNELWAEVDALFSTNPWPDEEAGGPLQQLAFMACYNIDAFRDYCRQHKLLKGYRLNKKERKEIEDHDPALLTFAFRWLLHTLGGRPTLISK